MSRRARHALKQAFRSDRDTLATLEGALIGELSAAQGPSPLQLELESSFHRLLLHGLASFHAFDSETVETAGGAKAIRVCARRPPDRGGAGGSSCVGYLSRLLGADEMDSTATMVAMATATATATAVA